jgi:hypothetical protein
MEKENIKRNSFKIGNKGSPAITENSKVVHQTFQNKTTISSEIPMNGYISRENGNSILKRYSCAPMLIIALFTIAKTQNQVSING